MRGFGGINLPEWAGSDMTSGQVQKAFGNGDDELGFTILRIWISDDKNGWGNAVQTAVAAQKMGATVFASPWYPPASMRQNGSGGPSGGKYRLKKDSYAAYATHLNDFCEFMKGKGVTLHSVSVQNEPDYAGDWTAWSSDETTDFLANYADKVTCCGVMSPETFQYTNKDFYSKILSNQKAMANTKLFATHFYGTQRGQMDFPQLESSGKDIWMTEVYVPNSNANSADNWPEALQVAINMHNGIVVGNLNAYVWWFIRRNYGPMKEDGNISKRGYMMGQYSKWVRPGDVRIDATESPQGNVYISAFKHGDSQVTIVAINAGNEYTQEFSISGKTISKVDRYRSSGNEKFAKTADLEHSGGSFFAQLPQNSVSTFVCTLG